MAGRRSCWRDESDVRREVIAGHAELGHRRHVRRGWRALRRAHRQHLHATGLHVRRDGGHCGVRHGDVAADERRDRLAGALVRDVDDAQAQRALERLGREVVDAAHPRGAVVELAGLRLGERDQLAEVLDRHPGVGDEEQVRGGDQADRDEILHRVVRQLHVEELVDRNLADVGDEERVAVRCSARHGFAAGNAARAPAVLDRHLLAEALGDFLRDDAGDRVRQSTGRVRHDPAHGLRGPRVLGDCRRRQLQNGEGREQTPNPLQRTVHGAPSSWRL